MKQTLILEGNLANLFVPDVLSFFNAIRKTGRSDFFQGHWEVNIYWKNGEIVFATSNREEDSLGKFLLRNGKITKEQYEESQKYLKPGTKHGKVLIKLGFITPKDLWWGVKEQVLEIIYQLFSWKEGKFLFFETKEEDFHQRIFLDLNTTNIIMEGVRRLDEWKLIKEKIPGPEVVFQKVPQEEEYINNLNLNDLERKALSLVDGKRNIFDIIQELNLSEFETHKILYSLHIAQLIAPISKPIEIKYDEEDKPNLLKVALRYNNLFQRIFNDLTKSVGETEAQITMNNILKQNPLSSELFQDTSFGKNGRFDENTLIANVSELPYGERLQVLDETLNTILSYLLFEVSQHLDNDSKTKLYSYISEEKRIWNDKF
jgi:hypothetical protein